MILNGKMLVVHLLITLCMDEVKFLFSLQVLVKFYFVELYGCNPNASKSFSVFGSFAVEVRASKYWLLFMS